MNDFEHLPNAPITEAIFDFRVEGAENLDPEVFKVAAERLADRYPICEAAQRWEALFQIKEGEVLPPAPPQSSPHGIFVRTADGEQLAQFRVDGFTFNRLQPYTRWSDLFPEAMRLWQLYSELSAPRRVTRLATRYINRMRFPVPIGDFGDWLTAPPAVPEGLPQGISQFLTRVTLHDPEGDQLAHVSQWLEPGEDQDNIVILLDIDAFRTVPLDPHAGAIAQTFESLRVFKNRIFFGSLTDKALGLFR